MEESGATAGSVTPINGSRSGRPKTFGSGTLVARILAAFRLLHKLVKLDEQYPVLYFVGTKCVCEFELC